MRISPISEPLPDSSATETKWATKPKFQSLSGKRANNASSRICRSDRLRTGGPNCNSSERTIKGATARGDMKVLERYRKRSGRWVLFVVTHAHSAMRQSVKASGPISKVYSFTGPRVIKLVDLSG